MPAKKKKITIEYRLFISPYYNEMRKKETTLFLLETIKEFSTFRYSIVLKETVKNKTIRLDILGLQTPEVTMPAFGSARKHIELDDLHGSYNVVVSKLDGAENHFSVKITKKGVTVKFHPAGKFITVFTNPEEWKSIHTYRPVINQ